MNDPRRVATRLDEAELDREAVITERDKVVDVSFWQLHGSPLTNALLDAAPEAPADAE